MKDKNDLKYKDHPKATVIEKNTMTEEETKKASEDFKERLKKLGRI